MADQLDVKHRLDTHDAEQLAVGLIAPERDPGGDLVVELARRHVGLVRAIGWDHAPIRLRGIVDDRENRGALVITTRANAAHDANLRRGDTMTSRHPARAHIWSARRGAVANDHLVW